MAWRRDMWQITGTFVTSYAISTTLQELGATSPSRRITTVYGPQSDPLKVAFLDELVQLQQSFLGPWLICGDLNMIYHAHDKSNDRLDRHCMRLFHDFLNRLQLEKINLVGRRFTWSNERDSPTLELLDRMLATIGWFADFPNHFLKPSLH